MVQRRQEDARHAVNGIRDHDFLCQLLVDRILNDGLRDFEQFHGKRHELAPRQATVAVSRRF